MNLASLATSLLFTAANVISAQPTISGAGYAVPVPAKVAPNQIVTFLVAGLGVVPRAINTSTPLGNTLGGMTAVLKQFNPDLPVPIFAIEPLSTCSDNTQPGCGTLTAITVLLPSGMHAADPNIAGAPIEPAHILFTGPNSTTARVDLSPLVDQIHVLATCDLVLQQREQTCQPIATHADGTFIKADSPAQPGEEIVIYGVGFGYVDRTRVQFDYRVNALPSRPLFDNAQHPAYVGLVSGFQGLYQVNVVIPEPPAGTLACSTPGYASDGVASNLTISIAGSTSFDGAAVCVQVPGS